MQLSQVADLARSLDVTSFVARMPDPVLVGADALDTLEKSGFDTPEKGTPLGGFRTQRSTERVQRGSVSETSIDFVTGMFDAAEAAVAEATPPSGTTADPRVISLAKSLRNPFAQMITIGRSPNNDVILDEKSVSKVHGYFRKTDFRWWLHDQPSTNGTYIDDERVGATGRPVADGSKVAFGPRLVYRFYTARGLHQLLTAKR